MYKCIWPIGIIPVSIHREWFMIHYKQITEYNEKSYRNSKTSVNYTSGSKPDIQKET